MSVIYRFTRQSVPVETRNTFQADFNVVPGRYSWVINPANAGQVVLEIDPRYTYMIDRVSFAASIGEGEYLRSIDVLPEFLFFYRASGQVAYPNRLPAVNYKDDLEFCFSFGSQIQGDALMVSMRGQMIQIPETVGIVSLYAHLSLVVYTEHSEIAVQAQKEETGKGVAQFYKGLR